MNGRKQHEGVTQAIHESFSLERINKGKDRTWYVYVENLRVVS